MLGEAPGRRLERPVEGGLQPGRPRHLDLLTFHSMDTKLLNTCFGMASESVFSDFTTDKKMFPFFLS